MQVLRDEEVHWFSRAIGKIARSPSLHAPLAAKPGAAGDTALRIAFEIQYQRDWRTPTDELLLNSEVGVGAGAQPHSIGVLRLQLPTSVPASRDWGRFATDPPVRQVGQRHLGQYGVTTCIPYQPAASAKRSS
jgi:hypothetical protein